MSLQQRYINTIRDFFQDMYQASTLIRKISTFHVYVINAQRIVRRALQISRARKECLKLYWDKNETLRRLESTNSSEKKKDKKKKDGSKIDTKIAENIRIAEVIIDRYVGEMFKTQKQGFLRKLKEYENQSRDKISAKRPYFKLFPKLDFMNELIDRAINENVAVV